jgi:hypothetical protein
VADGVGVTVPGAAHRGRDEHAAEEHAVPLDESVRVVPDTDADAEAHAATGAGACGMSE